MRISNDFTMNCAPTPIIRTRSCATSSQRPDSLASTARLGSRPFTIGCTSRRCLTDWNRSLTRYSMTPTSGTGEEDSTKDALRKIWREIQHGREWIVDADLRDFFGSVDHEKLEVLVNQRVSDGRVLRLIRSVLKAGCIAQGERLPTEQGTPQGGVISPLLSSILLTPF